MSKYNREVICIESGQAGVQLGHAMWELLTLEHHITSSGKIQESYEASDATQFGTFFHMSTDNQFYPRSLIFDSEPTVVDEIRCGFYRKLFNPDLLVNGTEDAANNFARGYFSESRRLMGILTDRLRRTIEHCDNLQGFVIQSGTAGGTGSGILAALSEHITIEFAGRTRVQLSILPGKKLSSCMVQPYNCMMMMEKLVYNSDINIILDNEMLYNICTNHLKIQRPCFSNINRIIAPILSGLTSSIRFKGAKHSDLTDISTNLIPYPRLHFPFASYAPLVNDEHFEHDLVNTETITRSIFNTDNQFVELDLKDGYFMASAIIYRGNCDFYEMVKAIQEIKATNDLNWVNWCPTAFKISHTQQTPFYIPGHGPSNCDKSAMMLSNHNGVVSTFRSLQNSFRKLFRSRAYIHWYEGEGMHESEIGDALFETETISDDYSSIVEEAEYVKDRGDSVITKKSSKDAMSESNFKLSNLERKSIKVSKKISNEIFDTITKHFDRSEMAKHNLEKSSFSDNSTNKQVESSVQNQSNYPTICHNYNSTISSSLLNSSGDSATATKLPISNTASNFIFDICERSSLSNNNQSSYDKNKYMTISNKMYFSQSKSTSDDNTTGSSIIQKLAKTKRNFLNKILHCQEYNFSNINMN